MKRILLCSALVMLSLITTNVYAYDIAVVNADGVTIYYNYINDGQELEVTYKPDNFWDNADTYTDNVIIPSEVTFLDRTRKVTSIGEYAFSFCSSLTSVVIPSSVMNIGKAAFTQCYRMTSVAIGNSVRAIGSSAFFGCSNLTTLTIPASVTCIGERAFGGCNSLTSLTIPVSVTSIGKNAFSGCSGLTSVTIPEGVTSIEEATFENCFGLTFVAIPDKVQRIGDNAFKYCVGLDSVSLGESVIDIGNYAFIGCKRMECITIPNSVETIGNQAFAECVGLTSLSIPDNVKSIGAYAFMNCEGLWDVTIGEGVSSIGESTFLGCYCLSQLTIGHNVTSIGPSAFWGCTSLRSLTIPHNVRSIGPRAFENCNLSVVTSLIKNPFAIEGKDSDNRPFSEYTFNNATLYVPLGSIDKYKATGGWRDFAQILTVHGLEYDYRPFIERAKVWRTGIPNPDGEGYSQMYHYIFCPDTLINGQRCTLMGRCRLVDYGDGIYGELDTVYVGALYEKDRQVFCAYPGSQELVLHYDFASPVGSVVSIGGNELAIVSKESVQGENYKGESVYLQSEDHVVCWQEGIGNRFSPMENLHGLHPASASDEVLISCSVGDEVLYYNGSPFAGGNEVKKNTIDFTHVVKTRPKAPRRGAVSESEDDEPLTGMYSLNNLFLNFKNLTGVFVVTIRNASGTEVYRKEVQTNNVVAINTVIGNYPKGMYTITVENDEEAYTAKLSIDEETAIQPLPLTPSPVSEGEAGAMYDLSGRRIANNSSARQLVHSSTLPKGIYIKDGRKVVVR